MWKTSGQREKMRPESHSIMILFFLLAIQTVSLATAQETVYQIVDFIDLPPELNFNRDTSCTMKFQEQWTFGAATFSVIKEVNEYEVSCADGSGDISTTKGAVRLRDISYEFSFLDPHHVPIKNLQSDIIALINNHYPVIKIYNLPEQLLSIYFHEEWIFDPDNKEIKKKVKGITPVIWQRRQTADGEPIHDAETGFPVYYKLKLERIDLRNP